jgi:hypothetical protein
MAVGRIQAQAGHERQWEMRLRVEIAVGDALKGRSRGEVGLRQQKMLNECMGVRGRMQTDTSKFEQGERWMGTTTEDGALGGHYNESRMSTAMREAERTHTHGTQRRMGTTIPASCLQLHP